MKFGFEVALINTWMSQLPELFWSVNEEVFYNFMVLS